MPPDAEGTPPAAAGSETPPNGAQGGTPPGGTPAGEQAVPFSRFQAQVRDLQAARDKIATYETEIANLRAVAGQVDTFKVRAAAAEARYESHAVIAQALGNFEPDIIGTVESKIQALPEAERAQGLPKILESWKADPSKAPPSVRPHFQPPPAPGRAPVDPHRGVVNTPNPAQSVPNADEIMVMSQADYIAYSNAERARRGLPPHPTKK